MAGLLSQTVEDWSKTPFIWGESDCAVSCLRYAEKVTGKTVKVQPTHTSEWTAKALAFLNGGIVRYTGLLLGELGLFETDNPMRGDIGIIHIAGMGKTLCVCLGNRWAAKGDFDILITYGQIIKCWRVKECPKQ